MSGPQNENRIMTRWQMAARIWLMPLLMASTAALGSYLGVLRAIDDLRAEIRVVRAEHQAAIEALRQRVTTVEQRTPRDVAGHRDLMDLREQLDEDMQRGLERHEQVYHHRRRNE